MGRRLSMAEAKALLPLLRVVSGEIRERQERLDALVARRDAWLADGHPEGLRAALESLDADIAGERRELERAYAELLSLGLEVFATDPLVVHIPGRTADGEVVFFWQEA